MKFRTNPDRAAAPSEPEKSGRDGWKTFDLVVAGGGASGVLAALAACDEGLPGDRAAVVEKDAQLLRKVRASGNGRCNLANSASEEEHYHGENPLFARGALRRTPAPALLSYFRSIGLLTKTDHAGRVYPRSMQAQSVVLVLQNALRKRNIHILTEVKIVRACRKEALFYLTLSKGEVMKARALIVACGGPAAPDLGGDTSGAALLMSFGHSCVAPVPALVPLELAPHPLLKLSEGVRFQGRASFEDGRGKRLHTASGEFLITSYGISGIAAMELGRSVSIALECSCSRLSGAADRDAVSVVSGPSCAADGSDVIPGLPREEDLPGSSAGKPEAGKSSDAGWLVIDFLPEMTEKEIVSFLSLHAGNGRKTAEMWREVLSGVIPEKIGTALLKACRENPDVRTLARMLKACRLQVKGTRGFAFAQVSAGGIATEEFIPSTMASRRVKGLFAAGEVLDIDGDTGGYNLMWAFSSGMLAGVSAARYLLSENDPAENRASHDGQFRGQRDE